MKVGDLLFYNGEKPKWKAPVNWYVRKITGIAQNSDYVEAGRIGDEGTSLWISMEEIIDGIWVHRPQVERKIK